MSIRIRRLRNGNTVALCAVESDHAPGDVYLDDAAHHALNVKFARDLAAEGFIRPDCLPLWRQADADDADSQRVRDAAEVHLRWRDREDAKRARCLALVKNPCLTGAVCRTHHIGGGCEVTVDEALRIADAQDVLHGLGSSDAATTLAAEVRRLQAELDHYCGECGGCDAHFKGCTNTAEET